MKATKLPRIKILIIICVILLPILFFGMRYFENMMRKKDNEPLLLSNDELLLKYNFLIQELKKTVYVSDYFIKWRWEKNMIEAVILDVDKATYDVVVEIQRPVGTILGKQKLRTHTLCTPDNTIQVSMDLKEDEANIIVKKVDFRITDFVKKGQILYTYCLSEDCSNVGKVCIIREK